MPSWLPAPRPTRRSPTDGHAGGSCNAHGILRSTHVPGVLFQGLRAPVRGSSGDRDQPASKACHSLDPWGNGLASRLFPISRSTRPRMTACATACRLFGASVAGTTAPPVSNRVVSGKYPCSTLCHRSQFLDTMKKSALRMIVTSRTPWRVVMMTPCSWFRVVRENDHLRDRGFFPARPDVA